MKTGLVLEGGAMRGLFTAGVLDAWLEAGLRFDGIVGVSAGACFGCNYKSHQPGRVIRYNRRFAKDPRYCGWRSLLRTGDIFNAEFCYRTLPLELDVFDGRTFKADPTEFYCVATDCESGQAVYHRCDEADAAALDWFRASASMPLVSRPVEIDGRKYLDGGLSDPIPLKWFERQGYARNVVVTTRPRNYRKAPSRLLPVLRPALAPAVYNALRRRPAIYNESMDYVDAREASGAAFVVSPAAPLEIPRICHDPALMQQTYDIGLAAGRATLPSLQQFW